MENLTEVKGDIFKDYINPLLGYELLISHDYGKFSSMIACAFKLTPMQWQHVRDIFNKNSICLN